VTIEGYIDYQRREFCKDVACSLQQELAKHPEGSPEYERLRATCRTDCLHTTWQFHHWLMDHGYVIVRKADVESPRKEET